MSGFGGCVRSVPVFAVTALAASRRGRRCAQDPSRPGCCRGTGTGTRRPSEQSARGLLANPVTDGVQVVGLFWRCDFSFHISQYFFFEIFLLAFP